jgi:hypothetical protein
MNKLIPTPQVLVDFYASVNVLESLLKNKHISEEEKMKIVNFLRGLILPTAK